MHTGFSAPVPALCAPEEVADPREIGYQGRRQSHGATLKLSFKPRFRDILTSYEDICVAAELKQTSLEANVDNPGGTRAASVHVV